MFLKFPLIFLILNILTHIARTENQFIDGTFQFCSLESPSDVSIDFSKGCQSTNQLNENEKFVERFDGHILSKKQRPFTASVVECVVRLYTLKVEAFRYKDPVILEQQTGAPYRISIEECLEMNRTRICNGSEMFCSGNNCVFVYPREIPSDLDIGTNWYAALDCELIYNKIEVESETSLVFDEPGCVYNQLSCERLKSTAVWTASSKDTCAFIYIQEAKFSIESQLLISNETLLFKVTEKVTECGVAMYKTTSDLYISRQFVYTQPTPIDFKASRGLLLAEIDYKNYLQDEKNAKITNTIIKSICKSNINLFKQLANNEDYFFEWHDSNKASLVFYVNQKKISLPSCESVNKIQIINNTETCARDFHIAFFIKSRLMHGFLRENGI